MISICLAYQSDPDLIAVAPGSEYRFAMMIWSWPLVPSWISAQQLERQLMTMLTTLQQLLDRKSLLPHLHPQQLPSQPQL